MKRDIVVAREEAIYVCAVEGRGSCYAYAGVYSYFRFSLYFDVKQMGTDIHCLRHTGNKSSVHTHLNYLIMVSLPFTPSAASASANVRNLIATHAPRDNRGDDFRSGE